MLFSKKHICGRDYVGWLHLLIEPFVLNFGRSEAAKRTGRKAVRIAHIWCFPNGEFNGSSSRRGYL
jgi:hypothetical protein